MFLLVSSELALLSQNEVISCISARLYNPDLILDLTQRLLDRGGNCDVTPSSFTGPCKDLVRTLQVSQRRQEIADRLNAWTIFNDKNKQFCDWLAQMENKVSHRGDLSIEEMVEKLKKVRETRPVTRSLTQAHSGKANARFLVGRSRSQPLGPAICLFWAALLPASACL